jgi:hypothetical protein
MAAIPEPRKPRCTRHHIWMAGCQDCHDQHIAEREEAQRRLDQGTR